MFHSYVSFPEGTLSGFDSSSWFLTGFHLLQQKMADRIRFKLLGSQALKRDLFWRIPSKLTNSYVYCGSPRYLRCHVGSLGLQAVSYIRKTLLQGPRRLPGSPMAWISLDDLWRWEPWNVIFKEDDQCKGKHTYLQTPLSRKKCLTCL